MMVTFNDLEPRQPENIALSFSGGGFCAATFGLGCLSYMDRVHFGKMKMTEMIRFVSSASGGTFTALCWTRSLVKQQPFPDFYREFLQMGLSGERLIERAFNILKDRAAWQARPDKSRNLINAFALAYDEILFKGDSFGIYYGQDAERLPFICANTTEFDNGEQFRFQNTAVAGNKFLHFLNDGASQAALEALKLGDILACSSCFTGGFEPVVYPKDFTYGTWTKDILSKALIMDTRFNPLKSDEILKPPVSFDLMDGGIDDNQGIYSYMLAESRLQDKNHFGHDLYMACDVSSDYTPGYRFPAAGKESFFQGLSLSNYGWMVVFLFLISLALLFFPETATAGAVATGVTGLLFIVVFSFCIILKSWLKKGVSKKNTFAIIGSRFISVFLNLPLHIFGPMLSSRISSTGYLATTVFLKKIRRISYDRLFEKITEHPASATGTNLKHWSRFCLQNAIYLLSEKNKTQRHQDLAQEKWFAHHPVLTHSNLKQTLEDWLEPSPAMQRTASEATQMDATLWFDENQERKKLPESIIATGQFTTCYNLLRYVYRFPTDDEYWKPIQNKLFEDWCRFLMDPFWLQKEYNRKPDDKTEDNY